MKHKKAELINLNLWYKKHNSEKVTGIILHTNIAVYVNIRSHVRRRYFKYFIAEILTSNTFPTKLLYLALRFHMLQGNTTTLYMIDDVIDRGDMNHYFNNKA